MARKFGSVLTIDELSAYLKISKSTLYKLAQQSKIPGLKVGRHWRFHRDAIDSWLQHGEGDGTGGMKPKREGRGK